ncbi:hypothetical protein Tco_0331180 [Tanacetum coccineum]
MIVKYDNSPYEEYHIGQKRRQFYAFRTSRESARDVTLKDGLLPVTKVEISRMARTISILTEAFVSRGCGRISTGCERKNKESYQKKLNLTKPDTYRSNLRRQDAYTPYSDPRGFIYENKDKKNRLMRIDELHKFSDGTLDDVRTALNDRLKGIRMAYLPQTFWSQRDKANARAMIQAIDKRLKTRRIMRSLERFVGGRPYGGDLRLLQRTI